LVVLGVGVKIDLTPLVRFVEHLPKDGDEELALLKCHLLVEEMLTKLIERNVRHPTYLRNARLSFETKMWIARSLDDLEPHVWVWGAVQRLNAARNALAHGLEAEHIRRKLEAFIAFVEAHQGAPEPEHLSGAIKRFQWAAFHVYSPLAAHAHFDLSDLRIPTLLTAGKERV
jgi:hypothetical protein